MRVWGRTTDIYGNKTWQEVSTDANGQNDAVYVTWLAQVIQLGLGESPFWANWGIPSQQAIITQVFPDFYVMQTQQNFSGLFANLSMYRIPNTLPPAYQVNVITQAGSIMQSFLVNGQQEIAV